MEAFGRPNYATLIHPTVCMSESVSVGKGTIICARTILTVEIVIGEHVILNLGVTIGHESEIKDFVTVAPQAAISGNVTLAETVEVGTGALIRQGLDVAVGGMVGMGAVLTKPVPENTIFAGNPARKLKEIQ
jgi:sugar O-acyltransferase (sialic acid O-acetyltransferase NeuD family)